MHHRVAFAALTLAVTLPFGPAAHAAGPPVTDDSSGWVTITIRLPGSPGGQGRSPVKNDKPVSINPCTTRYDPTGMVGEQYDWDGPGAPTEDQLGVGSVNWYAVSCPGQPERTMWTIAGQPAPGPPPPTPRELAVIARERMQLPQPEIRHNPTQRALVNLPTWLWLSDASWGVRSSSLTLRGTTVVATATPRRVEWRPGTGAMVTCQGQGRPYDTTLPAERQSTDCSYTYARSSAGRAGSVYDATATSVWSVHWVGTAPGQPTQEGDLDDLRLGTSFALEVAEIQTVVTSSG